jgi:hypothetical protein
MPLKTSWLGAPGRLIGEDWRGGLAQLQGLEVNAATKAWEEKKTKSPDICSSNWFFLGGCCLAGTPERTGGQHRQPIKKAGPFAVLPASAVLDMLV